MKDSLGDRMKLGYEDRFRFYLPRKIPCIIRLDGKAFHTFTKRFDRPFDARLSDAMNYAGQKLAEEVQGFKLAFLQSDECSILLTDYDTHETEAWFDYNKSKIETIAASCFTAHFNKYMSFELSVPSNSVALFDARSFPMPREDVANYFLWRAKDWERNSLAMYCQSMFSSKQLHGKNRQGQHEMLYLVGKNWANDLDDRWKNGTWLVNTSEGIVVRHDIQSAFASINAVVEPLISEKEIQKT